MFDYVLLAWMMNAAGVRAQCWSPAGRLEVCGFVGCLKAPVQDRAEYFEPESQFEEVNKSLIGA